MTTAVMVAAGERFVREVEAARRVPSHCTARIVDADLAGSSRYIVSEYVEGPTLQQAVEESGPRAGDDFLRLAIGTATALTAIHKAGVVHRDFKPANVILGVSGPRVIDFGIAREANTSSELTQGVIGTPPYMAPEQAQGAQITSAVDMFARGSVMVFAATGRPPFGTGPSAEIFDAIRWASPDLGELPGAVRSLVADCLAKEPADRPTAKVVLLRLPGHDDEPDVAKVDRARRRAHRRPARAGGHRSRGREHRL
ncbi:serine/threonine-protein kinase [Spirillospora sp. NPDC048911]|uniref:serine/threonine-protein kinase n=1 Tax=Spirillospora sp. NPDC048911 TaxID=3364527 RepID=UPI0037202B7D